MLKYNVKEFAEMLGISRRTMYRYIERGDITPKTNFRGKRFFTADQLEEYQNLINEEKENGISTDRI